MAQIASPRAQPASPTASQTHARRCRPSAERAANPAQMVEKTAKATKPSASTARTADSPPQPVISHADHATAAAAAVVAPNPNFDTGQRLATFWSPFAHSNISVTVGGPCSKRLRQLGDELLHAHPWAGEERRLLTDVAARVGSAQVAHQVDDAVQLRRLERQDPLVVAERERRHGVGPHVLVVTGGH